MKRPIATLLFAMATTASLPAAITILITDNVPNGSASGGGGSGAGVLTTSVGSISSDRGMPVTLYTISGLDFTSIGGTASESFTFTITYTATTDGSPSAPQFNGFGNVSATGGGNNNQVNANQTVTATIAFGSSTFANLSLDGLTQARAGGASSPNTGTITWGGGTHTVSQGNTIAAMQPANEGDPWYTSFTLSVDPERTLNVEGFTAQFTAIPEPSTAAFVVALGFGAFAFWRRRRKA